MPADLSVRCACGVLGGVVRGASRGRGNRVVCYCDDCQSFAHFLAGADWILDGHGGTDSFQMAPGCLEINAGREQLACMRLRPGGLLRWYARCCNTPVGNTLATPRVPFVGLIHSCTDHGSDGRSRDEALGPVRARVHARFALGDRAALDAHDRAPLSMLARFVWMILRARIRGEHAPSPFFDAETGEPSTRPHTLSQDEVRRLGRTRSN